MSDEQVAWQRIHDVCWTLHCWFPYVDKISMMKVLMILHRGAVNPVQVEKIIDEVFSET